MVAVSVVLSLFRRRPLPRWRARLGAGQRPEASQATLASRQGPERRGGPRTSGAWGGGGGGGGGVGWRGGAGKWAHTDRRGWLPRTMERAEAGIEARAMTPRRARAVRMSRIEFSSEILPKGRATEAR